jgi:hypothetical protein
MVLKRPRRAKAEVILTTRLITIRGKAQGRSRGKGELVAKVNELK